MLVRLLVCKKEAIRMRRMMVLLAASVWLFAGCEYIAPLTDEHSIAVDSSVLGLWELIPEEGKETKQDERMMILKYSETEYLIHYPAGEGGLYYRAYPIKIKDVSCVQLQVIGSEDGLPEKDETELFHVASYRLVDGRLEIKTLNTDLVKDDLKTTNALREAFIKHKDNKDLFKYPEVFKKAE